MPNAASESGTNSVSVIDANASGNPVHSTTRQKMSQTWFASHTGPIEWLMTCRGAPPAPRATGGEVPEPAAEVGPTEERVRGDAGHQDDGDDVAHLSPLSVLRTGPLRPRSVASRDTRLAATSLISPRSRCCAPGRSGPAPLRAGIPGSPPRRSSLPLSVLRTGPLRPRSVASRDTRLAATSLISPRSRDAGRFTRARPRAARRGRRGRRARPAATAGSSAAAPAPARRPPPRRSPGPRRT